MDKIGLSFLAYKSIPISSIIFSYGNRDGSTTNILGHNSKKEKNIKYQIYYKNNLPITTRPEGFGKIIRQKDNEYTISVNKNIFILRNIECEATQFRG